MSKNPPSEEWPDCTVCEGLKARIAELEAINKAFERNADYEGSIKAATIERCAQVAESAVHGTWSKDIAAAIRALKDKP